MESTMGTHFKMMVPGGWWHFEFEDGWFFSTFEKQEENPIRVKAYCPTDWSISSLRKDFLEVFGAYSTKRYPGGKIYLYPRYGRQLTLFRKFFWANADRKVVSLCLRTYGHLTLANYNSCTQGADQVFAGFEARLGHTLSPKNREDWMFLKTRLKGVGMTDNLFVRRVLEVPQVVSAEKAWAPWKASEIGSFNFVWFCKDRNSFVAAVSLRTDRRTRERQTVIKGLNENYCAALTKWLSVNDPLYKLFVGNPEVVEKLTYRGTGSYTGYSLIRQAKTRINEVPNWLKKLARRVLSCLDGDFTHTLGDIVRYLSRFEVDRADLDRWIAFWQKYLVAFSNNEVIMVGGQETRLLGVYRQIMPQDLSPGLSLRRTIENAQLRALDEQLARNKDLSEVVVEQPFELVIENWKVEFYSTLAQYYSRGQEHCHCLGGYFELACQGIVAVFGLVDPTGKKSTIQFELRDDKWELNQHRGKYNLVVDTPEYTITLADSKPKQVTHVSGWDGNFDPFEVN